MATEYIKYRIKPQDHVQPLARNERPNYMAHKRDFQAEYIRSIYEPVITHQEEQIKEGLVTSVGSFFLAVGTGVLTNSSPEFRHLAPGLEVGSIAGLVWGALWLTRGLDSREIAIYARDSELRAHFERQNPNSSQE